MAFVKRHKVFVGILAVYAVGVVVAATQPHGRYHSTLLFDFGAPLLVAGGAFLVIVLPVLIVGGMLVGLFFHWKDGPVQAGPSTATVHRQQLAEANNPYVTDYRYTPQPHDPELLQTLDALRQEVAKLREDAHIERHNAAVERRRAAKAAKKSRPRTARSDDEIHP